MSATAVMAVRCFSDSSSIMILLNVSMDMDCAARVAGSEPCLSASAGVFTGFHQILQRHVLPTSSAKLSQRNTHSDLVGPRRELAASLEGIEILQDLHQGFLDKIFGKGIELPPRRLHPSFQSAGKPSQEYGPQPRDCSVA